MWTQEHRCYQPDSRMIVLVLVCLSLGTRVVLAIDCGENEEYMGLGSCEGTCSKPNAECDWISSLFHLIPGCRCRADKGYNPPVLAIPCTGSVDLVKARATILTRSVPENVVQLGVTVLQIKATLDRLGMEAVCRIGNVNNSLGLLSLQALLPNLSNVAKTSGGTIVARVTNIAKIQAKPAPHNVNRSVNVFQATESGAPAGGLVSGDLKAALRTILTVRKQYVFSLSRSNAAGIKGGQIVALVTLIARIRVKPAPISAGRSVNVCLDWNGQCILKSQCTRHPDSHAYGKASNDSSSYVLSLGIVAYSVIQLGVITSIPTNPIQCARNERWNNCGTCDTYCENSGQACSTRCQQKCECVSGYIRGWDGKCIQRSQCTAHPDCARTSCAVGSLCVWKPQTCPSSNPNCIQVTCLQPPTPKPTTKPPTTSPRVITSIPTNPIQCAKNERWNNCGTCDTYCENSGQACTQQCQQKCECVRGNVKDWNGQCILKSQCTRHPDCNKIGCPSSWPCIWRPQTCPSSNPNCAQAICLQPTPTTTPTTTKPPIQCGRNQRWNNCGTCDTYCENSGQTCTQNCQQKCECVPGYVKDWDGNCITKSQCTRHPDCKLPLSLRIG
ncbi:hypothetical protein L596_020330 [Steinernema carpocapsae]|uniref:TIL domain-containing protein n=1 Tax=Steinernema carpocapsae TaxID=34508 RepID=A0A4U5MT78_STECR|nr:hypothetical protein L596_020330 [Steinernema carpocapsae]